MFKRKTEDARSLTKAEQRVRRMASYDLQMWAENALYGIGRSLRDWERDPETTPIQEVIIGAESLVVVLKEISRREVEGI